MQADCNTHKLKIYTKRAVKIQNCDIRRWNPSFYNSLFAFTVYY